MFIMSMNELNKKKANIIVCCSLVVLVALASFVIGAKTSQDDIVFELKYIDKELNAEYYALKNDNTLLWQCGEGVNSDYTLGSYFSCGHGFCKNGEMGYVIISGEDIKELKKEIKVTSKGFKALQTNPIKSKKGGQAIFFKYKNKYYNMEYPETEGNNIRAKQDMDSLREVFKACIDEYRASAEIY